MEPSRVLTVLTAGSGEGSQGMGLEKGSFLISSVSGLVPEHRPSRGGEMSREWDLGVKEGN